MEPLGSTSPAGSLSTGEFQRLAIEHMDTLYRLAVRLTNDPASAEDLVQETFLRAFRACKSFRLQDYGIRPWLIRILKNVHLSTIEHERLRPRNLEEGSLDRVAIDMDQVPVLSSDDPKLFDGFGEQLARALGNLPQHYQIVLLLWAVDDLSYAEIATSLKIPIGTVMSRLHRARSRLIERLGGDSFSDC
jgi:RNA polymerase sigma-70 factor, ECF subfamily